MGMRVGGSSNAWATQQNSAVGNWQQKQQNIKDLFTALKAGDITAAQKAVSSLDGTASGASTPTGPFAAISKALQSGDLQAAQKAAQAMPHHGHRHHMNASAPATAPAQASSSAASLLGIGNNINTTA